MSRHSFRRWVALVVLAGASLNFLRAAELETPTLAPEAAPEAAAGGGLSVSSAGKRAAWQQHLTLGPGDLLNLTLFDTADSARTDVPIGPDGRISFLQANEIMAAGLTIDELRAKLDESLGKFYQNPRTIVTPAAYRSKKYLVLGAVATKGVFIFDRPVTVIEAIARAGGLETGLSDQKTVEMTDLGHSFLVRKGQRVPVDFERLFQRGDLSQNVPLEPDDYLYFASATGNDIYVLGEVMSPGVVEFPARLSAISAITARGGFSPHAFQSRVLVVRGSLTHPETFVVDAQAILQGKVADFKLQSRDIVYVSTNPWKLGAEVLDAAAKAFIQSFLIQTTALHSQALIP